MIWLKPRGSGFQDGYERLTQREKVIVKDDTVSKTLEMFPCIMYIICLSENK